MVLGGEFWLKNFCEPPRLFAASRKDHVFLRTKIMAITLQPCTQPRVNWLSDTQKDYQSALLRLTQPTALLRDPGRGSEPLPSNFVFFKRIRAGQKYHFEGGVWSPRRAVRSYKRAVGCVNYNIALKKSYKRAVDCVNYNIALKIYLE